MLKLQWFTLIKMATNFIKTYDPATGATTFNTNPDGTGTTVQPADVIASMNNGGQFHNRSYEVEQRRFLYR